MSVWVTTDRHRFTRRTVHASAQQQEGFDQILDGLKGGERIAAHRRAVHQQRVDPGRRAIDASHDAQEPRSSRYATRPDFTCAAAPADRLVGAASAFSPRACWHFRELNIEAYPNPAPVILEITAQAPGLSAEEMERYYTVPMEVGLAATPGVNNIRSTSFYGLSFVRVTFDYGVDYYFADTQAALSLQQNVTPAQWGAATDPGLEPRRRDLSLPARRPAALRPDQSAHAPGLGAAASLPDRARHPAGGRLGRHDQGIPGRGRPSQARGLPRYRAAAHPGARQCEHQCRRPHGQLRPAVGQHSRASD